MTGLQSHRELRTEIGALVTIHAGLAAALLFLPQHLVVSATNRSVFRIMPDVLDIQGARILWAVAFLCCSASLGNLIRRQDQVAQFIAVGVTGFVNGWWFASYTLPLTVGHGNALGSIIFTALLAWPGFVIYRVIHGAGE